MKKALFDWPTVLQYDVKAKYQLIRCPRYDSSLATNQKPRAFVCVRLTNQIALSNSVLFARFHFKVMRKSLYLTIRSASEQDSHH